MPGIAGLLVRLWSVTILTLMSCSGGCSSTTSNKNNIISPSITGFSLLDIDNLVSAVKRSGGESTEMNTNQIVALTHCQDYCHQSVFQKSHAVE